MDVWRGAHQGAVRSGGVAGEVLLMEVLRAARTLLSLQERSGILARAAGSVPPSLSDAIERDFLTFEMQDAFGALRETVAAADAVAMPRG
ncbi:hypothetical protein C8P66_10393 [Humitalea rosea]|uniref:Uncharacterized protein n=1 Tax=Humitalea rosea TaxID=990373 RepID=A0A2W7IPB3_9PROT|nr:hypothetical protein [Humitalea rosea]PZW49067.1 hypothetical protein C8P66_10393 [Humitalea rosea]